MSNNLLVGNTNIELTDEQAAAIVAALREWNVVGIKKKRLSEFAPGEGVTIAGNEMVVLEQMDDTTAMIRKDCLGKESEFGASNNNYADSIVDCLCADFANRLAEDIGAENILEHDVDLTTLTGDKGYGSIRRHASLLTLSRYQKYVDILDKNKPERWWWLATANSSKRHDNEKWALCVSPSGHVYDDFCDLGNGVRPFCILKSDIFVSC